GPEGRRSAGCRSRARAAHGQDRAYQGPAEAAERARGLLDRDGAFRSAPGRTHRLEGPAAIPLAEATRSRGAFESLSHEAHSFRVVTTGTHEWVRSVVQGCDAARIRRAGCGLRQLRLPRDHG